MHSKQKEIKFIFHLDSQKQFLSQKSHILHCKTTYLCFLEIIEQNGPKNYEMCCTEHVNTILQKYETHQYSLVIILSSNLYNNAISILLRYRWLNITINSSRYTSAEVHNILIFGINTPKLIWHQPPNSATLLPLLLILLHKNMVDTIMLNQTSGILMFELCKLGLLMDRNIIRSVNNYVVELTDNNIKISIGLQQIYDREFVLNELNL